MGILKNIFKSLWGQEEESGAKPSEPVKPVETAKPAPPPTQYPASNQSYNSRPATESQPRTEPASAARIEQRPAVEQRPVEVSVRTPQPQPMPVTINTAEATHSPEVLPPPPAYQPPAQEQNFNNVPVADIISSPASAFSEAEIDSDGNGLAEIGAAVQEPEPGLSAAPISFDAPGSEANIFDEIADEFDEAFDAAFSMGAVASDAPIAAGEVQHDELAIQDLFANIAANYARPVKNFIFELKRGTATKEWIEICRPALRSISRAAESMELTNAAKRMVDFDEALSLAQTSEERVLGGEIRDLILTSYDDLIEVMPQTFIVGEEEQQREGIIINSLLKQIPDLGRVTFEKLYGAGLTSLDTLFLAKKEDLAAATGIPLWLCERICNKFQEYREELEGTPRDVAQSGYRTRLQELVAELRRQHEGFEQASAQEWSNPALAADKRKYRQNRQACVLQINVVLAEMGELDLVNEIQKLSFDRRIQRLEEYLQSTAGMM